MKWCGLLLFRMFSRSEQLAMGVQRKRNPKDSISFCEAANRGAPKGPLPHSHSVDTPNWVLHPDVQEFCL